MSQVTCSFLTLWCVPALRVPLVHSLINHFRQNLKTLSWRAVKGRNRRAARPDCERASC